MNKLIITNCYTTLKGLREYFKGIVNVKIEKISTPDEFYEKTCGYRYQCHEIHGSFEKEKDLTVLMDLLENYKAPCQDPNLWVAIAEPFYKSPEQSIPYIGEWVDQSLPKHLNHPILKYFKYDHLPERLQEVSKQFSDIAYDMDKRDLDADEKTAGLRKLLEAKDCFVRGGV